MLDLSIGCKCLGRNENEQDFPFLHQLLLTCAHMPLRRELYCSATAVKQETVKGRGCGTELDFNFIIKYFQIGLELKEVPV